MADGIQHDESLHYTSIVPTALAYEVMQDLYNQLQQFGTMI